MSACTCHHHQQLRERDTEIASLRDQLAAARTLLRRSVIELVYVNHGVEGCNTGLCATGEGLACIAEAEKLLGPVKMWPEIVRDGELIEDPPPADKGVL